MTRISLAEKAHQIIKNHLYNGDIAIDATCGNGHDTVFLAQQVGNTGQVYGFDIQSQAIASTTRRLSDTQLLDTVTLFQASHANMAEHVPEQHHCYIKAIMFNLGYLPGSDKSLITQTHSTIQALNVAIGLLAKTGVLTILVYPGHPGGDDETKEVNQWLEQLDQDHFNFTTFHSNVNKVSAPKLYAVKIV